MNQKKVIENSSKKCHFQLIGGLFLEVNDFISRDGKFTNFFKSFLGTSKKEKQSQNSLKKTLFPARRGTFFATPFLIGNRFFKITLRKRFLKITLKSKTHLQKNRVFSQIRGFFLTKFDQKLFFWHCLKNFHFSIQS